MSLRRIHFAFSIAAAVMSATCDRSPLLAPANSTITVSAQNRVLPIGGSTEVSAMVIEPAGTPVQNGTIVRFTTSLGRVDPVEAETRNGLATTTFFAGDAAGVAEVRATSGGAGGTSTTTTPSTPTSPSPSTPTTTSSSSNVVQISVGSAAVESITVRVNPSTVSANGGTVQVVATVVGPNGRTLPDLVVSFSATRGTLSSATAVTDANGDARVSLTTNGDTDVTATAGSKTSTAAKVTAQPAPSITLTCAVGSATNCATANIGENITFTASRATGSSNLVSSTLSFGDGQSINLGSLQSPASVSHRYGQAGTFTVALTATDVNGESISTQQIVRVEDVFTVTLTLTNPSGRQVDATATVNAGSITVQRYDWTFAPDGTPSSVPNGGSTASSTFTAAGTKTVTVQVTLSDGRTTSATRTIAVP